MPSSVVHYYFAGEVGKTVSEYAERLIGENRGAYNLGAQGPDVLFYLKFKGEPTLLGEHIHKAAEVFPMFEQSARYVREQDSDALAAFMLGQLCHYASDRVIHPYVYFLEKKLIPYYPANAHKHIHVLIESAFDYLCIRDYMKLKPARYRSSASVKAKKETIKEIARYYSELIAPLFGETLPQKTAEKMILRMRIFFKFCDDPTGIKYSLIRCVEKLIGAPKTISLFVRPKRERVEEDWFNKNRTPFPRYSNQDIMTKETFDELLVRASADATALINDFCGNLKDGAPLNSALYRLNYSG